MKEVLSRWIQVASETPHAEDLAFLFMATFFTVGLLLWLGGSNPQRPKRPSLLRNRVRN